MASGGWQKLKRRTEENKKINEEKTKHPRLTNWFATKSNDDRPDNDDGEEDQNTENAEHPDANIQPAPAPSVETTPFPHDIGKWEGISATPAMKDYLTAAGIFERCQFITHSFEESANKCAGDKFTRHCTKDMFFAKNPNGEVMKRQWLCYSPEKKRLFCSYCCLFQTKTQRESMYDPLIFGGFNE